MSSIQDAMKKDYQRTNAHGRFRGLLLTGILLLLGLTTTLSAQVVLHPSIGLQTFEFSGEPLAAQPLAPVSDRAAPLGGGLEGGQFGMRMQLEVMSDKDAILRFPISLEYFDLNGKTTFAYSSRREPRKKRLTFVHDASILSANIGATAAFFDERKIYISGELKGVYLPPTTLSARIYYGDNNETIQSSEVEPREGTFRIGGFARVGTQLPFFDPFLLDFSLGFGTLNLLMKETDQDLQRELLVVEDRVSEEGSLRYFSIGMSLVWKL